MIIMKHYVVMLDWATQDAEAVAIIGVVHTYEDAKKLFDEELVEEKGIAESKGYTVEVDEEDRFEAGIMGYWATEHSELYIQEVN
jgi:hypothetical protein